MTTLSSRLVAPMVGSAVSRPMRNLSEAASLVTTYSVLGSISTRAHLPPVNSWKLGVNDRHVHDKYAVEQIHALQERCFGGADASVRNRRGLIHPARHERVPLW